MWIAISNDGLRNCSRADRVWEHFLPSWTMSIQSLSLPRSIRHLARSFTGSRDTSVQDNGTGLSSGITEPLLSDQSVHYDSIYDSSEFADSRNSIEVMRKRLKYHFMSPYQKFRHRGRKPWKLCIQLLKLFVVTIQVCIIEIYSFQSDGTLVVLQKVVLVLIFLVGSGRTFLWSFGSATDECHLVSQCHLCWGSETRLVQTNRLVQTIADIAWLSTVWSNHGVHQELEEGCTTDVCLLGVCGLKMKWKISKLKVLV